MPRPYADIKVWLVDDGAYVAARSAEDAINHVIRECFTAPNTGEVQLTHEIEAEGPIDLTRTMHTTDSPGAPDDEVITFAEAIYRHGQEGGTFPTILASTEY